MDLDGPSDGECTENTNNRVLRIPILGLEKEPYPELRRELGTMRIERWFNVLVLGGAALGAGCGHDDPNEEEGSEPSTTTGAGNGGTSASSSGGTSGESSNGGASSGGVSNGGASNGGNETGGSPPNGGSGGQGAETSSGGAQAAGGSAGGGAGATGSGVGGSGAAAGGGSGGDGGGSAGMSGSAGGGPLECKLDPSGRGDPRDPCGCPCCWAVGCLNTDKDCCGGFCSAGDNGRGCCPDG
jgi:hypothetical protein